VRRRSRRPPVRRPGFRDEARAIIARGCGEPMRAT
jgi:hypothetical protein